MIRFPQRPLKVTYYTLKLREPVRLQEAEGRFRENLVFSTPARDRNTEHRPSPDSLCSFWGGRAGKGVSHRHTQTCVCVQPVRQEHKPFPARLAGSPQAAPHRRSYGNSASTEFCPEALPFLLRWSAGGRFHHLEVKSAGTPFLGPLRTPMPGITFLYLSGKRETLG